jgi:YVTN family beta-propeller protein
MKSRSLLAPIGGRSTALLTLAAAAFLAPVLLAQATATAPKVGNQVKVGQGLYELAVGESGPFADTVYVASAGDATIYGLDAKTLAVKSRIPVAEAAAYGVAINNRTQMLYTSNTRAGNVSAIDLKAGKIAAIIKTDADPRAHTFRVLVDEETNTIYVSITASPSKIWVIDGKTNTLAQTIENAGNRSTGLALDRAAKRLYTVSQNDAEVIAVDTTTNTVVNKFPSGGQRPTQMAFDPKTSRLWVTHQGTGDVTVLDTKTGALLKSVKTGAGALGIGFEPRANLVYVANRMAGTVTVIDAATYAVVADLKAGTLPNTVAIDSRNGTVYVTNKGGGGRGRAGAAGGRGAAAGPAGAPAATPAAPATLAAPPAAPPVDEGADTVTMIVR